MLRSFGILQKWSHIVDGIRNGFDVGIKEQFSDSIVHPNHSSSSLDPNFISSYIASEIAANRYSQAFSKSDLEELIGPFCSSPLGLVRKDVDSFRLIQDLSFPRHNDFPSSINSQVDSDDFPTSWGTFNITSHLILSLPDGCKAATFDISAAYCITPIRPDQQWALIVQWEGGYYVDRALPFGLTLSAGVFGSVADVVVDLYDHSKRFGLMVKWVDDFFVIRLPHQSWTEVEFMAFSAEFGVPWSLKKLRPLNHVQRYIVFDWDLIGKSVSLPEEKKTALLDTVHHWTSSSGRFSAGNALTLHGKLVFVASIFHLIRPYLPSLIHFADSFHDSRARLHPPRPLSKDLEWVEFLLRVLPVSMPLSTSDPTDLNWWGDASTSFGIGVVIGSFWASWQWAPTFHPGPYSVFNIGWAGAVAVELGVLLLIHLGLHNNSSSRHFLVHSDNAGVVEIIKKGRCRSPESNEVLKRIYRSLASEEISIKAGLVQSCLNISDALSRGDISAFLNGFPSASVKISFPPHPTSHQNYSVYDDRHRSRFPSTSSHHNATIPTSPQLQSAGQITRLERSQYTSPNNHGSRLAGIAQNQYVGDFHLRSSKLRSGSQEVPHFLRHLFDPRSQAFTGLSRGVTLLCSVGHGL